MAKKKTKSEGIFDQLADKSQKPDFLGYQPIDPKKWEAAVRSLSK